MINREFMRRLVFRIFHGNGGWQPFYLFYLGDGAQLVMSDKQVTANIGLEQSDAFNTAFSPHGNSFATDLGIGGHAEGGVFTFDRMANKNVGNLSSIGPKAVDVNPGLKQTAVVQNYYMSGVNDEHLQEDRNRIPLIASPIDPAVFLDPMLSFLTSGNDVEFQIDVDTDVRVASQLGDALLAKLLEARLRDGGPAFYGQNYPNSNDPTVVGDNPYIISYVNQGTTISGLKLFMTSSNLEVDDESKLMRLVGSMYSQPVSGPVGSNIDLLRLQLFTNVSHDPLINKNCVLLVADTRWKWYLPVLAHLSSSRVKTAGISTIYYAPWMRRSCHVLGFNVDNSPVLTVSSPVRATYSTRTVIAIDRPGPVGTATYFVERYLNEVIEMTLASHLPKVNPDGTVAEYFTKGNFIAYNNTKYWTEPHWCLQPVAFPSAQQPEDPWLYYVSMDENYDYWFNRQELGKAHVSEALFKIAAPPTQIQIFGGNAWLLFGTAIWRYNVTTGVITKYTTGTELPSVVLTSIAVDREVSKLWVGHQTGVFEFTNAVVSALNLSSIDVKQRKVRPQGLSAVNNFVAWVNDFELHGYDAESWVCRYDVTNSKLLSWDYGALCDSRDYSNYSKYRGRSIYGVNLRSNGDLIVMHSVNCVETGRSSSGSLTWCEVRADGTIFRRFVCKRAFPGSHDRGYSYSKLYSSPIHRIDDFHYTSVIFSYTELTSFLNTSAGSNPDNWGLSTIWLCNSMSGMNSSLVNDFRIDEENSAIYMHPMCNDASVFNPRVNANEQETRFSAHRTPIPQNSLHVRASDALYAFYSTTPIVLNNAYSLMVCGMQYMNHLGVELSWNGTAWVHGTAGISNKSKKTHTVAASVHPSLSIAFNAGSSYTGNTVYRVDTFPSTSSARDDLYMYLGDFVTETTNIVMTAATMKVPASELPSFYGVDIDRVETLGCSIGPTNLTYVAAPTLPDANQFSMTKDSLILHASRIGATASLTYNFVKQAEV